MALKVQWRRRPYRRFILPSPVHTMPSNAVFLEIGSLFFDGRDNKAACRRLPRQAPQSSRAKIEPRAPFSPAMLAAPMALLRGPDHDHFPHLARHSANIGAFMQRYSSLYPH